MRAFDFSANIERCENNCHREGACRVDDFTLWPRSTDTLDVLDSAQDRIFGSTHATVKHFLGRRELGSTRVAQDSTHGSCWFAVQRL